MWPPPVVTATTMGDGESAAFTVSLADLLAGTIENLIFSQALDTITSVIRTQVDAYLATVTFTI